MAHLQYVVACVFVLFLCVQKGYSLECYVCNSHNDTECSNTVPPERFKVSCRADKNETMCRKIKQVIDFEVNGLPPDSRIIRSCGWFNKSLTNYCYQRSGFGGRQEVCACNDKDLCNASNTLIVSYTFVLAFYAVLKICQH
ncbi:hypothetical protein ILUMI_26438 [Ignelater luminosus]|uniref:Protein sleepless n=1 Tax=Ignelater luminosus TaxID=2038154 RepID=A0A8K0FZ43_IGNLU|nr:hypothetical protein ILUMI_26438 [Ignelater luminosus]